MGKYDHLEREHLIRLLERRDAERQLGLVWEREELDPEAALNQDFVALEHDATLSHGDAPWRNLIIEGDNYDALRALRMSHAGRIRCIYIDPPYNTGNRDFVYNDRFVDKTHRFRHSLWLEFMHQRLVLARELLADDGVIFVSIDDNELFRLGMLMDRVFGEENFIANVIWQKRYTSANDHKTIAPMHEYLVVYRRSEFWTRNLLPRGAEKDRQYRFSDERGLYRCSDYTCNKTAEERPNLYYPIVQPNTRDEIWPKRTRVWAYSAEEHQRNVERDLVYWGKNGRGKTPAFKRYKDSLRNADGVVPNTWWTFDEVGHTDLAKKEVKQILFDDVEPFSTPKPVGLIERVLQIAMKPDDTVLDFFAGSGTTAHAVAKLNAEDGGNRRFILVSSTEATEDEPGKNLCRDVCAERVRRVLGGYTNAKGEHVEGLGGGFAYLRTRRIAPYRGSTRIAHDEVWRALQLIADRALTPWQGHGFQHDGTLGYLADFRAASLAALRAWLGDSAGAGHTLYAWTPQRLATIAPEADLAPIPDFLQARFGR